MFSGVHGCGAAGINYWPEKALQKVCFIMYGPFFLKFSHLPCEMCYDIFKHYNGARIHNFICVRFYILLFLFSSLPCPGTKVSVIITAVKMG
jgi:hypothetical protein